MAFDARVGDAALVRALVSLARSAPQRMRAAHLADRAEDLARRLEAAANLSREGE